MWRDVTERRQREGREREREQVRGRERRSESEVEYAKYLCNGFIVVVIFYDMQTDAIEEGY